MLSCQHLPLVMQNIMSWLLYAKNKVQASESQSSDGLIPATWQGPSRVTAAAWFPDGRRCITGFQNGSLLQWDGTTFQYLGNNNLHGTQIRCITWAHNGRFFLCGDGNVETKGKIIYWSPTLQPLQVRSHAWSHSLHRPQ